MEGNFKLEMAQEMTRLIGNYVSPENICMDNPIFFYHARGLRNGHPIVLSHIRRGILLIIPGMDYKRLDNSEITVSEYIATSYFYFGYYLKSGNFIDGAYWQPLELTKGIRDRSKIMRYLVITQCRNSRRLKSRELTRGDCNRCRIEATECLFSHFYSSKNHATEYIEIDLRKDLINEVKRRIYAELRFNVSEIKTHSYSNNILILTPDSIANETVKIYLSKRLLNDLLYFRNAQYDFEKIAYKMRLNLILGENSKMIEIPKNIPDKKKMCLNFWNGNKK